MQFFPFRGQSGNAPVARYPVRLALTQGRAKWVSVCTERRGKDGTSPTDRSAQSNGPTLA
jgi:hypothetical protein